MTRRQARNHYGRLWISDRLYDLTAWLDEIADRVRYRGRP